VTERVLRAKEIATAAHNGQKDKGGNDYIDHPRRVAEAVAHLGEDYEIVGWLHDVVEDTPITLDEIRREFGDVIADAVDSVTRRERESLHIQQREVYTEYILRAKKNEIGKQVKIADLLDNMQPDRLAQLPQHEQGVIKRYLRAMYRLTDDEFWNRTEEAIFC